MSLLLPLLTACTDGPELNAGNVEMVVSPTSADFGEVVLGNRATIGLRIRNEGYGELQISALTMTDDSSLDIAVVAFPAVLGHGEEDVLELSYTPDVEGQDFGTAQLVSNDEAAPLLEIALEGMGVLPRIDVDPEILYFGTLVPETSYTLSTRVTAAGSGNLRVTSVDLSGDDAGAYTYVLPDDWASPYVVTQGFSFPIEVTYTPPDEAEHAAELWIGSNDPEEAISVVRLFGNTTDDPTEDAPPVVEILDPDNGEYFMDDDTVAMSGYVFDEDEPATNLLCGWFADGTRISDGDVDGEGGVLGSGILPLGEVSLTLRCYDSTGLMGEDTTTLTVWPHDEPVVYTISGGESVFDWFSVDDDLIIYVNDTAVYTDANHTKDTHSPIEIEAELGDVLRIVATDVNYCDMMLDALVLHWGTGESQPLNDAQCDSACPDSACYTGAYDGPWPSAFLDESYTINIP